MNHPGKKANHSQKQSEVHPDLSRDVPAVELQKKPRLEPREKDSMLVVLGQEPGEREVFRELLSPP